MTADHLKVVHPQEDLLADQKAAVLAARVTIQELPVSSEDHATIQVPHVHHVPNHPTVFQEIVNHSIVITARVESAVRSEIVSHLMGKENRSIGKVASASPTRAVNASLLAERKTLHAHLTKEIIAGIAMRHLK